MCYREQIWAASKIDMVRNGCPSSAGAPLRFRVLIEGSGGWVVLSRERCRSDVHVPLQSPMSSQTSCSLLLSYIHAHPDGKWSSCIHWSRATWLHIRTQPCKWEQGIWHRSTMSPYEKSTVTSCVNKTLLSNLCNINLKVMDKSKSAFLALLCRGAKDCKMRCWQG